MFKVVLLLFITLVRNFFHYMQDSNSSKKSTRMLTITVTFALMFTLVSSAFLAGPFFIQGAWASPYVSSVSVSPSSAEKTKGETATYTVTVTRSSGSGSAKINLSFQSTTIPSSATHFEDSSGSTVTFISFGSGGSNSKSASLKIDTTNLSIDQHTFTVKGTKSDASSDSATSSSITLKVNKPPNQSPTAKITANPTTINEGDSSSLDATGSSDPDGTITKYEFSQTAGTSGSITVDSSNPAKATFQAPSSVSADETATIKVKVTDNDGATATDTVDIAVKNSNQAPTADAGNDQTVNEGDSVNLDGSGSSDSDGTIASYSWTQTAGASVSLSNADSAKPSFTAPDVGSDGDRLTFELKVTDNDGATATDSVSVKVNNVVVNQPPTSNAGDDQIVNEGDSVKLDGSASTDPDGDTLTYSWTQTAGTQVTLSDTSNVTPTFTAPSVGSNGDILTFELTIDDGNGHTDTDAVNVQVNNANQPPVAKITASPNSIEEGQTSSLDASSSSDSDGTITKYEFSQTAGTAGTISVDSNDPSKATFTSSSIDADETATITLKVTDNDGATATDTVDIVVTNHVNQAPIADAGADFAADEGTISVQLKGNGTDSDGTIASYKWEQVVQGTEPQVSLSNADTDTATFDAPAVSADTILTFKLTVTDNDGATADDAVAITIKNVNQPPVAKLTADPTSIEERSTSTLDASASTDDAGIAKYTFEQVGGTQGTITVDGANPAMATFTAPSITADEIATIKLTVEDAENAADSTTVEIAVKNAVPHTTTLILNTITSVPWGNDVTVTGKLTDNIAGGAGVSGATILFDGTGAGNLPSTTVTASDGTFTAKGASPTTVATGWKVQAHFAGTDDYAKSDSTVKTYSTTKHVVYIATSFKGTTGSTSSTPWSTATAFSITLTDSSTGGKVIEGKTIHFDGTGVIGVADVTTGVDGKAAGTGTAPNTVATGWTYTASFAGDGLYNAKTSATKSYSTTKHIVTLSISVPTTPVAPGASYKVSGTLTDSTAKVPLASKTITFTADTPITIADKTTNTNGFYSATQAAPTTSGTYNIQSHFAGDSLYNTKDSVVKALTVQ